MSRILVVDDNSQSRYLLEALLKCSGFDVDSAENGAQAFELAIKVHPDMIITDIMMPVMDGFTLCRKVKSSDKLKDIPLIFYSATYTDPVSVNFGLTLGAKTYMIKPQDPMILLDVVRDILEKDLKKRKASSSQLMTEFEFFREHNEILFHKLEKKMLELRNAREEADRANQAKTIFLAALSHELRTPLTSILTWAQLLNTGRLAPQKVLKAAAAIEKSAWNQKRMIDDLVDLSRISSGKCSLTSIPTDVTELVSVEIAKHRKEAAKKKIEMISELQPIREKLAIDPLRLGQILRNVLENSIKFTPQNGRIKVVMTFEGSKLSFSISDTGIGMDSAQLSHVCDPFFQINSSTTRTYGGLGIGLTVARNLVQAMGGEIHAESEGMQKGATFRVIIPYAPPKQMEETIKTETAPTQISPDPANFAPHLKGRRIVLVDDNSETLQALKTLLETYETSVEAVLSVSESVSAILREPPDVLISDISMPGEDGYSLMSKLKKMQEQKVIRKFPALALTAYADKQTCEKALSLGYDAYASKPVDTNQLLKILGSLMGPTI